MAYAGDAGLDLSSVERLVLRPGRRSMVGTGLAVAIPAGHAGFVQPRSGLAAKHGIAVVNSPGLIDAGYRGELRVVLLNTDPERDFTIEVGDRIAQLVILALPRIELVEVYELPGSERAERGFGSSRKRSSVRSRLSSPARSSWPSSPAPCPSSSCSSSG